jgi:hypothetical protein
VPGYLVSLDMRSPAEAEGVHSLEHAVAVLLYLA